MAGKKKEAEGSDVANALYAFVEYLTQGQNITLGKKLAPQEGLDRLHEFARDRDIDLTGAEVPETLQSEDENEPDGTAKKYRGRQKGVGSGLTEGGTQTD
jgi:hypothetical protein